MTEKSLLTLRDIAELLGIRYRSVIDCKDYFSDYLSSLYDGRHYRYWSDNLDFFELVFTLREHGYTFAMIRDYLTEKQGLSGLQALNNLMSSLTSGAEEEGGRTRRDENEGGGTKRKEDEGGGRRILEEEGENGTRKDGVGECGECFIQNSQLKDELQQELYAAVSSQAELVVQKKIKGLADALEDTLLNLTAEINGSMVQVYKALTQVQEGMNNLEERLGQLENDLGADPAEGVELSDLDLEKMQVSHPSINLVDAESIPQEAQESAPLDDYAYADLEFVRNSIHNGKPDKAAVTQWIRMEKEKDPEISYVELANKLNEAKYPP
ncbi:hypothetical protein Dthio_PD0072 [Desulfonatronospira thiodismutans ASO3-1]|uniref:Uncharacterized protein n=1 Tax=Desulfonatronospira thiodismutans ASO3-1 TaxID=555779 RepID=D6SV21_9BACT|nr:hypothetical protein [Desulfonatronospira thiodismutans]EFI32777.1 hypothetical protein Dthio_PD0072 [Desulfonatronospira thiodismutans ASO3-1]